MIRKVDTQNLDAVRYTQCLRASAQYEFQAELEYLKTTHDDWEFLIFNDYEAVMPLPIKRKLGIKFVIFPPLIQQLGVFSKVDDMALNETFYHDLKTHYNVYYYAFSAKNQLPNSLKRRKNYYIPSAPYREILKQYSTNRRRNIRPQDKNNIGLNISQGKDINDYKSFFDQHILGLETKRLKSYYFEILRRLYDQEWLNIYEVKKDQQLCSVAMILCGSRRNYLLGFINDKSISSNASSMVIDYILQHTIEATEFSCFGSNIPSVEMFYKRFGAKMETYAYLQNSKLGLIKNLIFQKSI